MQEKEQEPREIGILLTMGILLMPYIFVWQLFKKGYSNIARVVALSYLGFLVYSFAVATPDVKHGANTSVAIPSSSGISENADNSLYKNFSGYWVLPGLSHNFLGKFGPEGLSMSSEEHPIATAVFVNAVLAQAAAECDRPINHYGEIGSGALNEEQFLIDNGYRGHYYYAIGCELPKRSVSLYALVDESTMVSFLCDSASSCGDRRDIVKHVKMTE